MTDQDKLIKKGIKYTDTLFDEISRRVSKGVQSSDTLESFLNRYNKEFPDKKNPLIALKYDKEMINIILQETNNHKFSRPSQKELVRVTIENQVGELIKDVGDNITETVKGIAKVGYNEKWPQDKIADEISSHILGIGHSRARTIARTEIARTATISDYIVNKEMGATHFYVECRNTACPICKEAWHKHWSAANDDTFNPKETSAGGKGWIGDKEFSMDDTKMLPPIHPNCRCVPYFIKKDDGGQGLPGKQPEELPDLTPDQLKKLTPAERDKYEQYKRNIPRQQQWLRDNPNASPDVIAKHQKRLNFMQTKLNELKRKALGGSVTKPQRKVKPQKAAKPKREPEPKVEPKQSRLQPYDTGLPNNRKLHRTEWQGLTPADKSKYLKLKRDMDMYRKQYKDHVNYTETQRQHAWNMMLSLSDDWKKINRKALTLSKVKRKQAIKESKKRRLEIKKDTSIKYEDIKTPDDIAKHFGFEIKTTKDRDDNLESITFIDRDHNTEIYFDKYCVKGKGSKEYIDITNSGECQYDLKEIIKIYDQAPSNLKYATEHIEFKYAPRSRTLAYASLGEYEVRYTNGRVHPALVKKRPICVNPTALAADKTSRGNVAQSLYHEMDHCLDYALIKDKYAADVLGHPEKHTVDELNDIIEHRRSYYGISKDSEWEEACKKDSKFQKRRGYPVEEASWYGGPDEYGRDRPWENWAETGSMAAFENIKDKSMAVLQTYNYRSIEHNEWIKRHPHKYKYAVKKQKESNPSKFTW